MPQFFDFSTVSFMLLPASVAAPALAGHKHASRPNTRIRDDWFMEKELIAVLSVERAAGIEPAWPAWKAGTLPLSYAR